MTTISDPELTKRCKKCCEKMSENMYIIGNEPTLACYRIQEHVHKSGPMIIDKGTEMRKLSKHLQGCCYGLDYSCKAIKGMESSVQHFKNIQDLLKSSIFMKQQLNYEESLRSRLKNQNSPGSGTSSPLGEVKTRTTSSAKKTPFQRFSGSFDIPSSFSSPFSSGSIVAQLRGAASSSGSSNTRSTPPKITRGQTIHDVGGNDGETIVEDHGQV